MIQYKDLELATLLDLLTLFSKNYTQLLSKGHIHDHEFRRCREIIEEIQKVILDMVHEQKRGRHTATA